MRTVFGFLVAFLLLAGAPDDLLAVTKQTDAKPAAAKPATTKTTTAKPTVKTTAAMPTSIRGVPVIRRDPCVGRIAIDGATGKTLFEENADATVFPASVIKLMNLFVIMDQVQQGKVHLNDSVTITAEISKIGGSQVYLDPTESFTVEDLIYALMVQSANDAAAALAIHVAGSQQAFVELMNQKAQALGMTHTRFYSCHGLPPTPPRTPQEVDVSTPRELAILGRALVKTHPSILQYTSTKERTFRPAPKLFVMRNHNIRMLSSVAGLDGLKTGYFEAAGYSTMVTAQRNERRVFVVVAGSGKEIDYGKMRDKVATETLNRAFAALPPLPPAPPAAPATNLTPVAAMQPDPTSYTPAPPEKTGGSNWRTVAIVLAIAVVGTLVVTAFFAWRRRQHDGLILDDSLNLPRRPLPPRWK